MRDGMRISLCVRSSLLSVRFVLRNPEPCLEGSLRFRGVGSLPFRTVRNPPLTGGHHREAPMPAFPAPSATVAVALRDNASVIVQQITGTDPYRARALCDQVERYVHADLITRFVGIWMLVALIVGDPSAPGAVIVTHEDIAEIRDAVAAYVQAREA